MSFMAKSLYYFSIQYTVFFSIWLFFGSQVSVMEFQQMIKPVWSIDIISFECCIFLAK